MRTASPVLSLDKWEKILKGVALIEWKDFFMSYSRRFFI